MSYAPLYSYRRSCNCLISTDSITFLAIRIATSIAARSSVSLSWNTNENVQQNSRGLTAGNQVQTGMNVESPGREAIHQCQQGADTRVCRKNVISKVRCYSRLVQYRRFALPVWLTRGHLAHLERSRNQRQQAKQAQQPLHHGD